MTRKMLYRTLVATLLLPNFTAYWWMLPRRMKTIRTAMDAQRYIECQKLSAWFTSEFDRMSRTHAAIASGRAWPIEVGQFRIPFQVVTR